jgi:hypothetical protein
MLALSFRSHQLDHTRLSQEDSNATPPPIHSGTGNATNCICLSVLLSLELSFVVISRVLPLVNSAVTCLSDVALLQVEVTLSVCERLADDRAKMQRDGLGVLEAPLLGKL